MRIFQNGEDGYVASDRGRSLFFVDLELHDSIYLADEWGDDTPVDFFCQVLDRYIEEQGIGKSSSYDTTIEIFDNELGYTIVKVEKGDDTLEIKFTKEQFDEVISKFGVIK